MIGLFQYLSSLCYSSDFLWKVSLKIQNSGLIPKTFTHGLLPSIITKRVQMIELFFYFLFATVLTFYGKSASKYKIQD